MSDELIEHPRSWRDGSTVDFMIVKEVVIRGSDWGLLARLKPRLLLLADAIGLLLGECDGK